MQRRAQTHLLSLGVAIACGFVAYHLRPAANYPDFIAGWLGMQHLGKLGDLLAIPAAAIGWTATQLLRERGDREAASGNEIARGWFGDGAGGVLLLANVPALVGLAGTLMAGPPSLHLLVPSCLATLFVAAGSAPLKRAADENSDTRPSASLVGWGAFYALLLGLAPLCLTLFALRMRAQFSFEHGLRLPPFATLCAQALSCAVSCAWLRARWGRGRRDLGALPYLAQLSLPFGYAALYPMLLREPDGALVRLPASVVVRPLLCGLIGVALLQVLWRLTRRRAAASPAQTCVPAALFALVPLLRFPVTARPGISPDDYHFGERLLGSNFYGARHLPYVHYLPPHGFLEDDLSGLVGRWLYDGNVATLGEAERLVFCVAAGVAFVATLRWSKNLWLAYLVALFAGVRLTFLLGVPFLLLLAAPRLQRRTGAALLAWGLGCVALVLASPAQGAVLAAASTPLAGTIVWRRWGLLSRREVVLTTLAAAGLVAGVFASFVGAMLVGALAYVLANGAANQVGFGVSWAESWHVGKGRALPVDVVRMSWGVLWGVGLVVLARAWRTPWAKRVRAADAACALLFAAGMLSYAMGRIDPLAPSRPGHLAVFAWAFLLPWVLWPRTPAHGRPRLLACCYVMAAAVGISPLHPWWGVEPVLQIDTLTDAAALGLHAIGRAHIAPEHLAHLRAVGASLSRKLTPGESYLDLTNHNAHYAYFNRRPPVATTAFYNMAAWPLQRRATAQLTARAPRIALISAQNLVHDGTTLALRAPLLYREVVDHYVPTMDGPYLLGTRRTAADPPLSAAQARLLAAHVAQPELGRQCNAWGASLSSLRRRTVQLAGPEQLRPTLEDLRRAAPFGPAQAEGAHPAATLQLAGLQLTGRQANVLQFTFTCRGASATTRLRFTFWGDGAVGPEANAFDLHATASTGTLLVPLDAAPTWRRLARVDGVRIELERPTDCPEVDFQDFALVQVD